jgi:hypothetical protein
MAAGSRNVSVAQGFQSYLENQRFGRLDTAAYISVDSLDKLQPDLKAADLMVFRLGRVAGKGTAFGLAKKKSKDWSDYFLEDNDLFTGLTPEVFVPTVPYSSLYSFMLLPSMTETSLVNLALASGVISHVLGIENNGIPSVPATGQSTYSFQFRPHSAFPEYWTHDKGQVEMDGVFICSIKGNPTVVLIESKAGVQFGSLAKHKLFYPTLALRTRVPNYMPIVPIYLRAIKRDRDIHFYFARCEMPSVMGTMPAINQLEAKEMRHVILTGLNIQ